MSRDHRIADILNYWFDNLDQHGMSPPLQSKLWFQARAATDAHIKRDYGESVQQALAGGLNLWAARPGGLMALVLLLDQFTRNIHRGSSAAFSGDARALSLDPASWLGR